MNAIIRNRGLSLIELMIALAIGTLLVLGLVEVFAASRAAYQMSEGLARVQENGRFAMDYLQRDLRMAGHFGCVNDQARFLTAPPGYGTTFVTAAQRAAGNFDPAPDPLDFHVSIEGYEANGTAPGATLSLPQSGQWNGTPALPGYIQSLKPAPMPGSDVIVLRYLSPEGVPVTTFTAGASATLVVEKARWDAVIASGVTNPGLLGIGDCLNATVFNASQVAHAGANTTITIGTGGLNLSDFSPDRYLQGQAMLYRAESLVYYVAINVTTGQPALYRARFTAAPGAANFGSNPEELVEGIENLQLIYGLDHQADLSKPPSGYVSTQNVASAIPVDRWRRVGLVQVAFLSKSVNPALADSAAQKPRLLGVGITPPNDRSYRTVYESTISVRNRLYGN